MNEKFVGRIQAELAVTEIGGHEIGHGNVEAKDFAVIRTRCGAAILDADGHGRVKYRKEGEKFMTCRRKRHNIILR